MSEKGFFRRVTAVFESGTSGRGGVLKSGGWNDEDD
jgi:hypothetical protein